MSTQTQRETEILTLLFRFPYLSRTHIQRILGHSHHSKVISWLKSLTEQGLISRHYVRTIESKPATYSLTNAGRQKLSTRKQKATKEKPYDRDKEQHWLRVADSYLDLLQQAQKNGGGLHFSTSLELRGTRHLPKPLPDAYVAIEVPEKETVRYFLEVLDDQPAMALRRKARRYLDYYESDEWQENTDRPFPGIVLLCPNERMKFHLTHLLNGAAENGPKFLISVNGSDSSLYAVSKRFLSGEDLL